MSHKHENLLRAIFEGPVSGNVHWREVEAMLAHLGANVQQAATHSKKPNTTPAQQNDTVSGDKTTVMVVDAVVMRPLGLAATVVGTVLTVVALPFTIPSGSVETSARQLILRPADYTFKRPLGDFSDSGEDGRSRSAAVLQSDRAA